MFIKCPDCGKLVSESPGAMGAHKRHFCSVALKTVSVRPVAQVVAARSAQAEKRMVSESLESGDMKLSQIKTGEANGNVYKLREALEPLTKRQLDEFESGEFGKFLKEGGGVDERPLIDYKATKPTIISGITRWALRNGRVTETLKFAHYLSGEKGFEQQEVAQSYANNLAILKKLPEWKQVLERAGGYKPRKFVERLRVIMTPASWNPTSVGDFDSCSTYFYDGKRHALQDGPSYSYDTLPSAAGRSGLHERAVQLNPGDRFWNVVYSGQTGGSWRKVDVYLSPEQNLTLSRTALLPARAK